MACLQQMHCVRYVAWNVDCALHIQPIIMLLADFDHLQVQTRAPVWHIHIPGIDISIKQKTHTPTRYTELLFLLLCYLQASGPGGGTAPYFGGIGGSGIGGGGGYGSTSRGAGDSAFADAAGSPHDPRSSFGGPDGLTSPFANGIDNSCNHLAADSQLLAPTMSYMPLPPDVESGLRRSQPSFVPARTGSRVVSRNAGSRLRSLRVVSGKVAVHQSMKDVVDADAAEDAAAAAAADAGAGAAAGGGLGAADDASVLGQQQQYMQQDHQAPSVRQRARNLWNGLFGERHDVRMYKDMVVKQHKVRLAWGV
jgi:hypothetical protein